MTMRKHTLFLNGQALVEGEGRDYHIQGEDILFAFNVRGPLESTKPDIAMKDTYEDGVLVQREIYRVVTTAAGERMKWSQKIIEKFREKDL